MNDPNTEALLPRLIDMFAQRHYGEGESAFQKRNSYRIVENLSIM